MQYGSKLHMPPVKCNLRAAQQEPYKKAELLTKTNQHENDKNTLLTTVF